ncbi:MAG: NAD(P)H nitroreductase [Mycobacteriales bacterium]
MTPTTTHDPFTEALAGAATPTAYLDAAHRAIVHAATLAPSVHNSQPWRFTSDDTGLDLYADDGRRLSVLDPQGRLMHLSCGAALLHAQTAAYALGFIADAVLFPDPADPTHLARLTLVAGPPGTAGDQRLSNAMRTRRTFRGAFAQRPVPGDLLERLRLAAEAEGVALTPVLGDDLIELEVLLAWADHLQEDDPAYRDEITASVRTAPSADGIPDWALAPDPERGSSLRLRDFALTGPPVPGLDGAEPPTPEKPDVVLIVTEDDNPKAWLCAGKALAAVLLHAADAGVMGQPLAQATDFPAARSRLHKALGLVGIPQMALRLGYADPVAPTPRRDVDEVLTAALTATRSDNDNPDSNLV